MLGSNLRGCGRIDIHDLHDLAEAWELSDELPTTADNEAPSVEDEFIIRAAQVDVDGVAVCAPCA